MPPKKPADNPRYRKPEAPNRRHRALHHDYTRPARYMITLGKAASTPALSVISGTPQQPVAEPTAAGTHFREALAQWCGVFPQLRVDALAIMPDHIHFCLTVRNGLPNGLSRAMALLMGKTTVRSGLSEPFFAKGFTDSIAYSDRQYDAQKQYVLDNPRRLLVKRAFPDLYRRRWIISVGNLRLMAIGNIYLLKNPHLQTVRHSRRFSEARLEENRRNWVRCVENGGALISPFIHPRENAMRKEAMSRGGNIIRICENGFSDRFAPSGLEFDLMGTQRLLLIGPVDYSSEKQEMKYAYAQRLNSIAELLASHPPGMTIRPAGK